MIRRLQLSGTKAENQVKKKHKEERVLEETERLIETFSSPHLLLIQVYSRHAFFLFVPSSPYLAQPTVSVHCTRMPRLQCSVSY